LFVTFQQILKTGEEDTDDDEDEEAVEEALAEAEAMANDNILHFFYTKDRTGLADMANVEGGTKAINTGKINKATNNFKAQMILCFNNSKEELPDSLKKFQLASSNSVGDLIAFSVPYI
jgi:hypothetical protein